MFVRVLTLAVGMMVVLVPFTVLMLVMMLLAMFAIAIPVAVAMLSMDMRMLGPVFMFMFILIVGVHRPFMDGEVNAFDVEALLPLEVHVKIANLQLRQLPLKGGGFDAEVAKSANRHVAADARKTI